MPIELNKLQSAKHTVKVPLKFETNGTSTTEQLRVVYRGVSLAEADQRANALKESTDQRATLIEQLAATVIELPDVVDQGQPVPPSAEFFQSLDTYYLFRISQAITDDQQGNG